QDRVTKLLIWLARKELLGLVVIGFGVRELVLGVGALERRSLLGAVVFRRPQGKLGDVGRGQAAEQVEPGEIGPSLEAGPQPDLGLRGALAREVEKGRKALGPVMVRLQPQRRVKPPARLAPALALVFFQTGQKQIERHGRLDPPGFLTLPPCPDSVAR